MFLSCAGEGGLKLIAGEFRNAFRTQVVTDEVAAIKQELKMTLD
jgi:hypothetical protein